MTKPEITDAERIALLKTVFDVAATIAIYFRKSPGGDQYTYDGSTNHIDDLKDAVLEYELATINEDSEDAPDE